MKAILFSTKITLSDLALLILRVSTGAMMLTHGWPKLANYAERSLNFRDPIGIGSAFSLQLAIFAEVICALLIIVGLATRVALIPLIITMTVAAFIVHADDPFSKQELALLYLFPFISLLFLGPGRFSVDALIKK
jgi:putative oxidoreductase